MKILLIDEDKHVMPQLCEVLRATRIEVVQAHDLEEVRTYMDQDFEGIILDLMMPPIKGIPAEDSNAGYTSGVWLYLNVIESGRLNSVPFVVLTAVKSGTRIESIAYNMLRGKKGFRGILQKPQLASKLVEALS